MELEEFAMDERSDGGVEEGDRVRFGKGGFEIMEVDAASGAETEHDAFVVEVEVGEGFGFFDAFSS